MRKTLAKRIGERLRTVREERLNISQEELSDRSGVHVTHISRLENGQMLPSLETLLKICLALHAPLSEFVPDGASQAQPSGDFVSREILRSLQKMSVSVRKTVLKLIKCYGSSAAAADR